MKCLRATILFALFCPLAPAMPVSLLGQTTGAQATTPISLEGLWVANRRLGPDARGSLVIYRDRGAMRSEIAGYSVVAQVSADTVSLALPDSAGWFTGRLTPDGRTIAGHWIQPNVAYSGQRYASPVVLQRSAANRWTGNVVPLDDVMTLYLKVARRPDGTFGTFIRNPQRNLGTQLRADRLEQSDSEIRLIGRRNGNGPERVLASGAATGDGFSLYFPNRGTFEFERVPEGAYSNFYPRGYPSASYVYRVPPMLSDGWATSSAAGERISEDSVTAFVRMLINTRMDSLTSPQVHAFLIARHGRLVVEEYFHGESRENTHETRSAGKSVTSTLVGAVIHAGLPVSLSMPAFAAMNNGSFPAGLDAHKRSITMEHLLSQTAGLDCDDSDPNSPGREDAIIDQDAEPDYYKLILKLGTIRDPGTKAVYCSVNAHLAAGVLQASTHRSLVDLFQNLLAQPLGITRYYLPLTPTGVMYGAGGVRLRARDFTKIGQTYLDNGMWRGHRILDSSFVARASEPRFAMADVRYGLLWWVVDYPFRGRMVRGYYADGNGGQLVMVIPSLDMVVTFFAGDYAEFEGSRRPRKTYVPNYILPAVMDFVSRGATTH